MRDTERQFGEGALAVLLVAFFLFPVVFPRAFAPSPPPTAAARETLAAKPEAGEPAKTPGGALAAEPAKAEPAEPEPAKPEPAKAEPGKPAAGAPAAGAPAGGAPAAGAPAAGAPVEPAQEVPPALELFMAPSALPSGESWLLLGSGEAIPEDLVLSPGGPEVTILELSRLSSKAVALRLNVGASASGDLLSVSSSTRTPRVERTAVRGEAVPLLTLPANYSEEDMVLGRLQVRRRGFAYGYLPATVNGLAAVRVHNRATGEWERREHALERAIAAAKLAEALAELPPGIHYVDPRETLVDTNGDGVPDVDEEPLAEIPRPDFLGIPVEFGLNVLDIVAVDELGNVSWETLNVER